MGQLKIGRYLVNITNEERILFPKSKIKKIELIDYYFDSADIMIPHMKNRALTMVRYPNGIDKEGFYQKDMPTYFPDWIKGKTVKKKEDGTTTYVVCNNAATLVYLANQACITPHLWLSKIDKLDYPDKMIFDIDPPPPGRNFTLVGHIALRLKDILEEIGLVPFVKTTGSKGLHVVVPIRRTENFKTVRAFAVAIAQILVDDDPKHLTLEIRKEKREGRVFLDTLRNAFGQTAVAPYAVRPTEKAPIATPILWDEVRDAKLTSQRYNINNIFKYLDKNGDVWMNMSKSAKGLKAAEKKLKKISKKIMTHFPIIALLIFSPHLTAMEPTQESLNKIDTMQQDLNSMELGDYFHTPPPSFFCLLCNNEICEDFSEHIKYFCHEQVIDSEDLLNAHSDNTPLLQEKKKIPISRTNSIHCCTCAERHATTLFGLPESINILENETIIDHMVKVHILPNFCKLCNQSLKEDSIEHAKRHYQTMTDNSDYTYIRPSYYPLKSKQKK